MLIQSLFSGDIRCGGIGIRLISDFSEVWSAAPVRAGNEGTEVGAGPVVEEGLVSIISSSSSPWSTSSTTTTVAEVVAWGSGS